MSSVDEVSTNVLLVCTPAGELQQKEGSKLGAKADFAKLVALNLFHFMVSRSATTVTACTASCIPFAGGTLMPLTSCWQHE